MKISICLTWFHFGELVEP